MTKNQTSSLMINWKLFSLCPLEIVIAEQNLPSHSPNMSSPSPQIEGMHFWIKHLSFLPTLDFELRAAKLEFNHTRTLGLLTSSIELFIIPNCQIDTFLKYREPHKCAVHTHTSVYLCYTWLLALLYLKMIFSGP